MKDVAGKTAFITGGASGMGLGMAIAFAQAGMKVAIADLREKALEEAMGYFAPEHQVMPVLLDVTDRARWPDAVAMGSSADPHRSIDCRRHGTCVSVPEPRPDGGAQHHNP